MINSEKYKERNAQQYKLKKKERKKKTIYSSTVCVQKRCGRLRNSFFSEWSSFSSCRPQAFISLQGGKKEIN